jgi:hypothetical protein
MSTQPKNAPAAAALTAHENPKIHLPKRRDRIVKTILEAE